ncbi:hypothetical protein NDU88_005010, partial [Pleurodeles waltl]
GSTIVVCPVRGKGERVHAAPVLACRLKELKHHELPLLHWISEHCICIPTTKRHDYI